MINITFQELEDRFLVSLEGKIDSAACAEVEKTLQPIYTGACKGKDIYFDCETLVKPNDYIKEVFTITGFINFFEM